MERVKSAAIELLVSSAMANAYSCADPHPLRSPYWKELARSKVNFTALTRALGLPQVIDALRITGDDRCFDVVVRIDDSVLIERARQWPIEALLRLRPRLISLPGDVPLGVVAERIVQWCKGTSFKAVRVKPTGSLWVDYVRSSQ